MSQYLTPFSSSLFACDVCVYVCVQVRALSQVCAARFPLVCAAFLLDRAQALYAADPHAPPTVRRHSRARMLSPADSEAVIAWQAYALIIDALLPRLEENAAAAARQAAQGGSPPMTALAASVAEEAAAGPLLYSLLRGLLAWVPVGGPGRCDCLSI